MRHSAAPGVFLCFGYGYSASALGRRLLARGWRVIGTTRSVEKAAALRDGGVEALVAPVDDPRPAIAAASHLLISAGPTAEGDPTLAWCGDAIRAAAADFDWAGYLSTTGVYGDHDGAWIDETAPRSPATERGRLRVAAEDAWLTLHRDAGLPLHVFRLAGIYGPGRGPFAKLRSGKARRIVKPGQVFSRIHVEDIATALEASMARPDPGAAYNVCDDDPAPPQEVIAHAADLLGVEPPPEEPFEAARRSMSPMAVSFYAESKRVSNAKIKQALGVELRYPDYRSGLAAVLEEEAAS